MRETRGFWDLAARPAALWVIYFSVLPGILAGGSALSVLPSINSMWRANLPSPVLAAALWREAILIAFAFAMCVSAVTSPMRAQTFGWKIPTLRVQLATAAVVMMLTASALVAFIHWGLGGTPIVGASIAALTFAVMVSSGSGVRMLPAIALLLAGSVARPTLVLPYTHGVAGLILTTLAGATAVWLMSRMFSRDVHRAQALPALQADEEQSRSRWFPRLRESESALPSTSSSGLLRWVQMARFAKSRSRASLMKGQLYLAGFYSVWCYADNRLSFIVTMAMFAAFYHLGLPGRSAYPVSRNARASVAFIEHLEAALLYCVTSGVVLYALFALHPFPQFLADARPDVNPGILVTMVIIAIFLPIARWPATCPPMLDATTDPRGERSEGYLPRVILSTMVYTISAMSFRFWYELHEYQLSVPLAALLLTSLFIVTHTIYFIALRRAYQTRDLI